MNTTPTFRTGRTRHSSGPSGGILSLLFLLLLLSAPPLFLLRSESTRHSRHIALSDAMSELSNADPSILRVGSGALFHGTSSDISTLATDPRTNLSLPGALLLRRNTEYCQWSEHPLRTCRTCTRTVRAEDGSSAQESYDCECTTQYTYLKAWRGSLIGSILFDQPGAHYNPQRDPMPSATFVGEATVGLELEGDGVEIRLNPEILKDGVRNQPFRKVDFVFRGKEPRSLFGWWRGNTRYEPLDLLRDTVTSPAATEDNFVYVGQGGYFFSPYENSSTTQRLFKYFVQYLEGSLFDWQIGNLMPSCTAGDIRFSYQVQDPSVISFLGQVLPSLELAPRDSIGFVHAGSHSAPEMIVAEDVASRNAAMLIRAVLLVWSLPVSRLVGVGLGRDVGESSGAVQVMALLGVFASVLGAVWLVLWGGEVGWRDGVMSVVVGVWFGVLAVRLGVRRGRGRWWRAVWCRLGRWADVPPEWRVEDSYVVDGSSMGGHSKRL